MSVGERRRNLAARGGQRYARQEAWRAEEGVVGPEAAAGRGGGFGAARRSGIVWRMAPAACPSRETG
jgi:hypothetical protein